VGRTHGVHAEPTTFGFKLAGHAFESRRNEERLEAAFAAFEPHVKLADRMRGAGPMRMAASEAAT
jgi:adenylosuccinate lyase